MSGFRLVVPGLGGPGNGYAILMANIEKAIREHEEWLLACYFQEWWAEALCRHVPRVAVLPGAADHQHHWTDGFLRHVRRVPPLPPVLSCIPEEPPVRRRSWDQQGQQTWTVIHEEELEVEGWVYPAVGVEELR